MIATNLLLIAQNFSDIYDAIEYKLGSVTKEIGLIPSQIVQINGAGGYTPRPIASPSDTRQSILTYLYNLVSEIRTCIIQSGVNVTGMSNYAATIRSIGAAPAVHTFVISGLSTITGETAEYLALYDNASVSATWLITAGNQYATISNGEITILSGANNSSVTIQASYNGLIATKTITVTYESGTSSTTETETETTVDPQTGATTETTTTTVTTTDEQGNTTTSTVVTETTTNQDGSSSTTEAETINNSDGSSTSNSTTTNYDENGDVTGSTTNTTNVASDGSSNSSTTNYDENGDPIDKTNEAIDVSGNVSTQDIEYENGEPIVTGYTIDTTENPDGSKTFNEQGVNTEYYAFDLTRGFTAHIAFTMNYTQQPANQNENHHNILTMKRANPSPWYGFQLRQTSTNKYIILGTQFATGSNVNTNITGQAINGNSNFCKFDLTITYNPTVSSNKFVCYNNLTNKNVYTSNLTFPDIDELKYLKVTIGCAMDPDGNTYRYSNIDVLDFSINRM